MFSGMNSPTMAKRTPMTINAKAYGMLRLLTIVVTVSSLSVVYSTKEYV